MEKEKAKLNWKERDKLDRAIKHLMWTQVHLEYGKLKNKFAKERRQLFLIGVNLESTLYTKQEIKAWLQTLPKRYKTVMENWLTELFSEKEA